MKIGQGINQIYLYKKLQMQMNVNRPSMLSQYIVKDLIQKSILKIQKMIQQTPLIVSVNQPSLASQKSNKSIRSKQSNRSNRLNVSIKSNKTNNSKKSLNKINIKEEIPNQKQSIKSQTQRIHENQTLSKSKVSDKHTQKQLSIKAEEFVNNLRKKKNQIQGKIYLLKQAQNRRKSQAKRKEQIEKQVQAQIKRKIRKINAQKNIQYYNEKRKLYVNKQALSKSRAQSVSQINQSKFQKIILPPIHPNQLQQIQQQQADNFPESLKKTVIKSNQKKRSKTQADMRQKATNYLPPKQSSVPKQIKLFSRQRQLDDKRKSYRQYLKMQEQRYNLDKKCYLISKNYNAQQIADYLQKYQNLNKVISPKKSWAEKIARGKQKNKSKYITRSRTNFEEQEDYQQYQRSQNEKETTQRKIN